MDLQARLPPALAVIHNFIHHNDPEDLEDFAEAQDLEQGFVVGELATGQPTRVEREQVNVRQNQIAEAMWAQYQAELQKRGA